LAVGKKNGVGFWCGCFYVVLAAIIFKRNWRKAYASTLRREPNGLEGEKKN